MWRSHDDFGLLPATFESPVKLSNRFAALEEEDESIHPVDLSSAGDSAKGVKPPSALVMSAGEGVTSGNMPLSDMCAATES